MGYLLGIDLGSSSVKASLLDAGTGVCAASAFYPKDEQEIISTEPGFAEQDPKVWSENARTAIAAALATAGADARDITAIGISYQMHGLVCVDAAGEVLRPAIIWCDSRAVPYGAAAYAELGPERCMVSLLNSPGNFTAAKLAWVKENEPDIYARIDKVMLPGDWLAMRLTGRAVTTASGLSEGILWDFKADQPAGFLLDHFGFDPAILPEIAPSFGPQGEVSERGAREFGLCAGTPVTYRGGDQPNNALSLKVLEPGEIAATAGTSGVVYGVSDQKRSDQLARFNTFLHLNHSPSQPRLGVLLCINGAGILNSWTRRLLGFESYEQMNELAGAAPIGSNGLRVMPFGNGAERMLGNWTPGAEFAAIDFNRHGRGEICRAVQEGIAFAFQYGIEGMRSAGIDLRTIRAGYANMFMSEVFCKTFAGVSGARIELYETDGALGAARGAGYGCGAYATLAEAFESLAIRRVVEPEAGDYGSFYELWKDRLNKTVKENRDEHN